MRRLRQTFFPVAYRCQFDGAFRLFLALSLQSSQSSLTKMRSWKEIMDDKEYRGSTRRDNDTRPISLLQRVCVHPSCIALRVSRIFSEFSAPVAGNGESTQSSIFRIKKSCLSASSSLPFHVIVFALLYSNERFLTLIPGDPSTRVVAFVTCRKCFSSMREKGSPFLAG